MRNGGAAHKTIEAPQNFDSASRRRHFERSREIFIAERSSPDVRQHQDIVFPRRIHADSRSAVKTLGCARDDDARESQSLVTSHQSLTPSYSPMLSNGIKRRPALRANPEPINPSPLSML